MTKTMLIDATSPLETRVAVMDGAHLEEFDYESAARRALKGNIYLAKVTRVEPSLQACFVEYGGNRHGFLPFSDIHPDYFRIPVADREAFEAARAEALERAAAAEAEEEAAADAQESEDEDADDEENGEGEEGADSDADSSDADSEDAGTEEESTKARRGRRGRRSRYGTRRSEARSKSVEVLGGDHAYEEELAFRYDLRRQYKIQEVIHRGQIMLVQVSREERGAKGAAVTTYLSLPGRYCVLMPNSPRGGGVSRKIAGSNDRTKMRDLLRELEVPQGMSVILRTAGLSRTKTEIKRDLDYLMRLWDDLRAATLASSAPALIYEEADLIKRAIRDLYKKDMDHIIVAGEEGHKAARKIMKMMIPSHVKRVTLHEGDVPLFAQHGIEDRIARMAEPRVELKSGGSLVINPTEALVAIDVNSGRATRGRHIEETALKTNLEAADEVARQLRLRDLGGLIVIDFIDMDDRKSNTKVEQRMKVALSGDRARIQVGRISAFGLLEMSRQRINPSLAEVQSDVCAACGGTGRVRSAEATSLALLREIEAAAMKARGGAHVVARCTGPVALYLLNEARGSLAAIEERAEAVVQVEVDATFAPGETAVSVQASGDDRPQRQQTPASRPPPRVNDDEDEEEGEEVAAADEETEDSRSARTGRRRGGRGRSRARQEQEPEVAAAAEVPAEAAAAEPAPQAKPEEAAGHPPKAAPLPEGPLSSVTYEVVSEPPPETARPKKGWWNRLME
jgi:ribonuclease E